MKLECRGLAPRGVCNRGGRPVPSVVGRDSGRGRDMRRVRPTHTGAPTARWGFVRDLGAREDAPAHTAMLRYFFVGS